MVELGDGVREAQEGMQRDLRAMFRGAIRASLELFLEAELEALVGAEWYARAGGRRDRRNGTYVRQLLTSLGQIEVVVPRSRASGSPSEVLGRYQRRTDEIDALLTTAYVNGVSQRKAGELTEALVGERVSRSAVSRVAKRLDTQVDALRRAPITGDHPYLCLDATVMNARWARTVENVSAPIAYAVGPDRHRHLLGVALGAEEWETQLPEAMECLTKGFAAATTFYAFPSAHWRRLRTTNSLERLHGEIKRRTKAVGAFPDRASALRLITAVALKVTTIWSDRRYLDLSLLENVEVDQAA